MSAYCAAKAGLERFGDALRLEVAHRGVTVASAHPTWIDTDLVRDTEEALPTFAATRKQLPGPLGAFTSVEDVRPGAGGEPGDPPPPGVRAGLGRRRLGAAADGHRRASPRRLAMLVSAKRVPQLETDIAALGGREFGKNSVGAQARQPPPATRAA